MQCLKTHFDRVKSQQDVRYPRQHSARTTCLFTATIAAKLLMMASLAARLPGELIGMPRSRRIPPTGIAFHRNLTEKIAGHLSTRRAVD